MNRGSFRQAHLVIEQIAMLHGAVGLFEKRCSLSPDVEKMLSQAALSLPLKTSQPLLHCVFHRARECFSGKTSQFVNESTGLFVFNIQAHKCIYTLHG